MAARKTTNRKKPATKARTTTTTRKIRPGFISHTELVSADPTATKAWCQKVLGWKFGDPMPTPTGPYHLWNFGNNMGGGIRLNSPPELPGSIPYCEVPNIKAAYERAVREGAKPMFPPDQIPGDNGWLAIVEAPGGVTIGFWGTK